MQGKKTAISMLAWKKHSRYIFYLEGVSLWSDLLRATNSCFFLTSLGVFSIISNLISSATWECFRYLHFSTTCLPFSLLKLASTMFRHRTAGPSTQGQWQHKYSYLLYSLSFGLCHLSLRPAFPPAIENPCCFSPTQNKSGERCILLLLIKLLK